MNQVDVLRLIRYKQWCNSLLLEHFSKYTADQLKSSFQASFGSIIDTLHHTYLMDQVWKERIEGQETALKSRGPSEDIEFKVLSEQQRAIDQWFLQFCENSSELDLRRVIEFTFIAGGPGKMSVQDILLHVVNHGTYHRGHVVAMANLVGDFPPSTDYPIFLKAQS